MKKSNLLLNWLYLVISVAFFIFGFYLYFISKKIPFDKFLFSSGLIGVLILGQSFHLWVQPSNFLINQKSLTLRNKKLFAIIGLFFCLTSLFVLWIYSIPIFLKWACFLGVIYMSWKQLKILTKNDL